MALINGKIHVTDHARLRFLQHFRGEDPNLIPNELYLGSIVKDDRKRYFKLRCTSHGPESIYIEYKGRIYVGKYIDQKKDLKFIVLTCFPSIKKEETDKKIREWEARIKKIKNNLRERYDD